MIKSFFFVFIGAMLGPPWRFILLGVLLGAVLFAARIPGVYLSLLGTKLSPSEKKLAGVAMPRGMAAGVLATLPVSAGVPGTEMLPVVVFACVFTTIMVFAVGFPVLRSRMEPGPVSDRVSHIPLPAASARPLGHGSFEEQVVPGGGAATPGTGPVEAVPVPAGAAPVAVDPDLTEPMEPLAPDTEREPS